ncbi:hypothetical protein C5167_011800 [Papaver somniferum]|nr:hypothetical protein C5167_011800 [Papaver somniferum]
MNSCTRAGIVNVGAIKSGPEILEIKASPKAGWEAGMISHFHYTVSISRLCGVKPITAASHDDFLGIPTNQ